jgi:hypothetical protein
LLKEANRIPLIRTRLPLCDGGNGAVKPNLRAQNAAPMALVVYWIAYRLEGLASPLTAQQTAKMLRGQQKAEFLKAFKIWHLGNLVEDKAVKP